MSMVEMRLKLLEIHVEDHTMERVLQVLSEGIHEAGSRLDAPRLPGRGRNLFTLAMAQR